MMTIIKRFFAATFLFCGVCSLSAQDKSIAYFGLGWQYGSPFSNGFVNKPSGYGFYLEGGRYLNDKFSVGAFLNAQTNYEYTPRSSYPVGTSGTLTTDMQHGLYQLPFGVTARYRFLTGRVQPFLALKVGANYAYAYTDVPTLRYYDKSWGAYFSPEIGVVAFPFGFRSVGFNLSAFYSFSTNESVPFLQGFNGVNTAGLRLGLIF